MATFSSRQRLHCVSLLFLVLACLKIDYSIEYSRFCLWSPPMNLESSVSFWYASFRNDLVWLLNRALNCPPHMPM